MTLGSFQSLVHALDRAGVRYLVAGGLAVNAYGYVRFTRDVDVVLLRRWARLSLEEIVRAQEEMQRLADSLGPSS